MAQRPSNIPQDDWDALQGELGRIGANNSGVPLEKLINAGPEDLGNDANIELLWAEKAFKHAETFFKILQCMPDKKKIKLTQSVRRGKREHTMDSMERTNRWM